MSQRPPLPPFTYETAVEKVRLAEDAWNTRDPEKVALGYTVDRRDEVSDIHDPRRLNPVLVFQELDASDTERRRQRNRSGRRRDRSGDVCQDEVARPRPRGLSRQQRCHRVLFRHRRSAADRPDAHQRQ